jgi:hypothetical protein
VALNTITLPLKRKLKRKLCTDYEKKLLYSLKFARKMTCLSSLKGNNSDLSLTLNFLFPVFFKRRLLIFGKWRM